MSLTLSSEAPSGVLAEPALRLNKRELARSLGVSVPTVNAWLDRYPDFPILQSGTNGSPWQFDPVAVRAFMDTKEREEDAAEAIRDAAIAQLGLALEDQDPDQSGVLSPRERLDNVRAIQAEDKLRQERGFLVSVPAQRHALTNAISRWNRALQAAVRQAGKDFNLPDAVVRGLSERLAETQRQFVRELGRDAGLADSAQHAA